MTVRLQDLESQTAFDAPALGMWKPLTSGVLPLNRLIVLIGAVAVVVTLTTRKGWIVPLSMVAACAATMPVVIRDTAVGRAESRELAFVDRSLGTSASSIVIDAGLPDARCSTLDLTVLSLWAEFHNIAASRAAHIFGDSGLAYFASPRLSIRADGTLMLGRGPLVADAVVIDDRLPLRGDRLSGVKVASLGGDLADGIGGLALWRTNGVVRLEDMARLTRLAKRPACPVVLRRS